MLRAFSYFDPVTPEEHAQVRQILERAVRGAPDQGEIWAMLSTMYWHEHASDSTRNPILLDVRWQPPGAAWTRRPPTTLAIALWPSTLFLQKNILAFRPAAERAIELNRMDGSSLAMWAF